MAEIIDASHSLYIQISYTIQKFKYIGEIPANSNIMRLT